MSKKITAFDKLVVGREYEINDVLGLGLFNRRLPQKFKGEFVRIDEVGDAEFYVPTLEGENGNLQWAADTYFSRGLVEIVDLTVDTTPTVSRAGAAKKLSPQCQMILNHLRKGHSITQRSALLDFGIMALPRRIADLKESGHKIVSTIETNKLTGQRYARYSLVEDIPVAA